MIIEDLRQHRIIQVCGLRGQIFRQCGQIISSHTDVWVLIFGHNDGTICKQGVRRELCGAALKVDLSEAARDKLKEIISDTVESKIQKEVKKITKKLTVKLIVTGIALAGVCLLVGNSDKIVELVTKPKN